MKSLIKAAAERQYRCRYVKTRDLMEDIAIAVDEKRFSRLADQLDRYDLIGLDDFNLLKAKDEVREAMLELFDRRWNKRGLIISVSTRLINGTSISEEEEIRGMP